MSFTLIDKAYIANAKQITQIVEGIGWVKPSESFKQVVPITSKNIPSIKYDQAFIVFSLGPMVQLILTVTLVNARFPLKILNT
jgi:hypothetical protein